MNPPPDEATAGALKRFDRDVTTLFREKASRREHDALTRTVVAQGEQIDGLGREKADKSDVSEIRADVEAVRRAIVQGSIAIVVSVIGSAAVYWFLAAHP